MAILNLMKQALGNQWDVLPLALRAHYQDGANKDVGKLSVDYPSWMQCFLNALHFIGALLNRKGSNINAIVEKGMKGDVQYWKRTLSFDDGKNIYFKSRWQFAGGNKLIEYVNPFIGLCMSVEVREGMLFYYGEYFVLKLGAIRITLPEWLLLGHTTIVEKGIDDTHFEMDFRLTHPLFGQIYRYSGRFTTVGKTKERI